MTLLADFNDDLRARGWAHVPDYCNPQTLRDLQEATSDLANAPGAAAGCLYYLDRLKGGEARLARVERVADALQSPACDRLKARMQSDAARYFDAPVQPFKDKLNIRYPQSSGYAPHQDAARWEMFGERFVSIGIFLGASEPETGGFEFANGDVRRVGDDLDTDQFSALPRTSVRAAPGDALFIDGMTPHRTFDNIGPDRVLHLLFTFVVNGVSEAREAYYVDQKARFAQLALGNMFLFPARP